MLNIHEFRRDVTRVIKSEAKRLMLLEAMAGDRVNDSINGRARVAEQMKQAAKDGKVFVVIWQRDCDGVEYIDSYPIPATLLEYRRLCEYVYGKAEGPVSFSISAEEVKHETIGHGWGIK